MGYDCSISVRLRENEDVSRRVFISAAVGFSGAIAALGELYYISWAICDK